MHNLRIKKSVLDVWLKHAVLMTWGAVPPLLWQVSFIYDSCATCSSGRANFEDVLEATAGCLPGLSLQGQRCPPLGLSSNILFASRNNVVNVKPGIKTAGFRSWHLEGMCMVFCWGIHEHGACFPCVLTVLHSSELLAKTFNLRTFPFKGEAYQPLGHNAKFAGFLHECVRKLFIELTPGLNGPCIKFWSFALDVINGLHPWVWRTCQVGLSSFPFKHVVF